MNDKILVETTRTWTLPDKKILAKIFKVEEREVEKIFKSFFEPIEEYFNAKE